MLSNSQINKLCRHYYNDCPDCEEKELFFTLIKEYEDYKKSGSPEDCAQRLDWMSLSYENIRQNFNDFVVEMKKEVDIIRQGAKIEEYAYKIKKGRPSKNKE